MIHISSFSSIVIWLKLSVMRILIAKMDEILIQIKSRNFWKPVLNLILLCLGCQPTNEEGNINLEISELFGWEYKENLSSSSSNFHTITVRTRVATLFKTFDRIKTRTKQAFKILIWLALSILRFYGPLNIHIFHKTILYGSYLILTKWA